MMIEIKLRRFGSTFIDDCDADLTMFRWHRTNKYAARSKKNEKAILLHRVILERILGRPLAKGEVCDHIDRNPLNNVRSNLRLATHSQNMMNRVSRRIPASGYRGVRQGRTRSGNMYWEAGISVNKHHYNLGKFDTPEEAHNAYCEAAKKYHGEFAQFEINKKPTYVGVRIDSE